ncbi:hypothetical protein GF312_10275 [Candidatus Poribacteria bacterium]|nr:hypothetical protein [Candidatus Poribacteria bacterium]
MYFNRREQRIVIFIGFAAVLAISILVVKILEPGVFLSFSTGMPVSISGSKYKLIENTSSQPDGKIEEDSKNSPGSIDDRININTASKDELESLPRIGPVLAGRIIDYRNEYGLFACIEEIINIHGIGDKTLEKLRNFITVENQSTNQGKKINEIYKNRKNINRSNGRNGNSGCS